ISARATPGVLQTTDAARRDDLRVFATYDVNGAGDPPVEFPPAAHWSAFTKSRGDSGRSSIFDLAPELPAAPREGIESLRAMRLRGRSSGDRVMRSIQLAPASVPRLRATRGAERETFPLEQLSEAEKVDAVTEPPALRLAMPDLKLLDIFERGGKFRGEVGIPEKDEA